LGGGHEAAVASSGDRALPPAGARHSLDSALVTTLWVNVTTERTGCHQHARRNREEATGTLRIHHIVDVPSIILIRGASIILIALISFLIGYSVSAMILVLPQMTFALIGGFLLRRFRDDRATSPNPVPMGQ
jgi:hypothetical protein